MARRLTKNLREVIETVVKLDGIHSITVKYAKVGPGQAGARHFITSYYPVLQYHNTELELNINKVVDTEPAQLTILKTDGSSVEENITDLHKDDILKLVTGDA